MLREELLTNWLKNIFQDKIFTLEFAAADADYRRYFRAQFADNTSVICMDAPPEKMNITPFIEVNALFQSVSVPKIIHYDKALGFMVLEDLGKITYLTALLHDERESVHKTLLLEAIDTLIDLQLSSQPGMLPDYDYATLLREINLFPEWFATHELKKPFSMKHKKLWQQGSEILLNNIAQQEKVYVHRDFMVRNLMLNKDRPGVLDFQDALYGPITYDIASLTKDAFIEWEEAFLLDIVIRYWEKAKAKQLPVANNFDEFFRDYEWMGVQRHLKVIGIFSRLYHRDNKEKYRAEIPRFIRYLKKTTRRYVELSPFYQILQDLCPEDNDIKTGYTF